MPGFSGQKRACLEKWLEQTLATYPSQTRGLLLHEKDRFRNPVGHTLREGLTTLWEEIAGDMNLGRLRPALEGIIRLRAVQDFTPGQAVGFIYLLRDIFHEEGTSGIPLDWQKRIDQVALLAFDLYVGCREQTYEIKAREAQRKVFVLERLYQRT